MSINDALWISKDYKMKTKNRKRDKNIMHYINARVRRGIDRIDTSFGYENRDYLAAPYFAKIINVDNITSASVDITGLGYFELYINGRKVGDDIFSPPFSQYEKQVYYLTYDIKDYLIEGENTFVVVLGSGMYNVHVNNSWNYDVAQFRGLPKFIMSGHINGQKIQSDLSWKVRTGPITSEDIYTGEYYDANKEFDINNIIFDESWEDVVVVESPTEQLCKMEMEPIKEIEEIKPVNFWKLDDKYVFDLGQNITGYARLKTNEAKGTTINLLYGEMLVGQEVEMKFLHRHTSKKDQHLLQIDKYTCKGGEETWQPRFTYHGFQYVEVTGLSNASLDSITGILIHNDLERIGNFESSNKLLNKIFEIGDIANTNNLQSIPTDCPHREKNGWTGDLNLSYEYFFMTYDADKFFTKWLNDIKNTQKNTGQISCIAPNPGWGYDHISGPVWDATYLITPWNMYLYYANTDIIRKLYPHLQEYIKWQKTHEVLGLIRYGLGDWCSPNRKANKPKSPRNYTTTLYHFETVRLMSKFAKILNKLEDQKMYQQHAENLRKSIIKNFINTETGFIKGDCQTSYSAAIFFNIVEGELKDKVVKRLVKEVEKANYHLDTGIIGTKFLLEALSDNGYHNLALKITTQKTFPSWGYWVMQGATTMWENWNGDDSRNHRMFNSVNSWMYKYLAGINVDENKPGFQKIIIKPHFDELDFVKAHTFTKFGKVAVEWKKVNNKIELTINAPDECEVEVIVNTSEDELINNHNYQVQYACVANKKRD